WHPDFEAFEILGRVDRMRATGDLPIPVVPNLVERKQARLLDRTADVPAQRAVHCRPDLVIVLEAETNAVDRSDRHDSRQYQPGEVEQLDHPSAQLGQHVGISAELAIGKNLDLHAPTGLLPNTFHRLLEMDVHGMYRHHIV